MSTSSFCDCGLEPRRIEFVYDAGPIIAEVGRAFVFWTGFVPRDRKSIGEHLGILGG